MTDFSREELFSLCSLPSVSGFEARATEALWGLYGARFDEHTADRVGNHIFLKRCIRDDAPTLLIDTHFDEIGMVVSGIEEGGFLRVAPVGGLSPAVLQSADMLVYGKKTLRGVILSTPPHLRSQKEDTLPSAEELMVDVGYPKEELESLVPIGTPIGFAPHYTTLACGALAGKSFDNKACAALAAHAILNTPREALAAHVALLFSSFEETSVLGGVTPATLGIDPDYAMVIDVNLACVPHADKTETVPVGGGISLSLSTSTDPRLTAAVRALCDQKEIPYTPIAAPASTGTNAASVNLTGNGVPVVDVGLPLKNMHTYNEVFAPEDGEALCALVEAFITDQTIAAAFRRTGKELP